LQPQLLPHLLRLLRGLGRSLFRRLLFRTRFGSIGLSPRFLLLRRIRLLLRRIRLLLRRRCLGLGLSLLILRLLRR
jgi:hypothetical protein